MSQPLLFKVQRKYPASYHLVGSSPAMQQVYQKTRMSFQDRYDGAYCRRNGYRQGTGCRSDPPVEFAGDCSTREGELRRLLQTSVGKRAFRHVKGALQGQPRIG